MAGWVVVSGRDPAGDGGVQLILGTLVLLVAVVVAAAAGVGIGMAAETALARMRQRLDVR